MEPIFPSIFAHFFKHVLHIFFTTFSKKVETHFGTHFGIRVAQEGQDEPKRAIRSFKEPKTFIFKNHKKPIGFLKVFGYRGLSRKPQEAEEGSQKAPKKSKTPKNRNPKSNPKIIKNWEPIFGAHSENQAQPKSARKKLDFGTPFPRISGVQIMPRQKINERGKKAFLTGIILYKRKRGVRPYKAL